MKKAIKKRKTYRKAVKIKQNGEILQIIKFGKKVKKSQIIVYFGKNEKNHTRCSVIVSSKTGNAVHRSRIKRLIREAFRKRQAKEEKPCDILIKVNSEKKINEETLLQELLQTWQDIKN